MTYNYRETRRIYSMYDVLELDGHTDKIVCPLPQHNHSHNTPSFRIFTADDNTERFQCFGTCGLEGDVIDLAGYMWVDGYDGKDRTKVKEAVLYLSSNASPVSIPKVTIPRGGLAPGAWRDYWPPSQEVIDYARTRGLHENTLKHFLIGQHKHFMVIPAIEEGVLKALKLRNTWPKEMCTEEDFDHMRFAAVKGSRSALFNYDAVAYTQRPLLFLKGEIPVMLMHQFNILSCSTTHGEAGKIVDWLPLFTFSKKVIVVGDNDENFQTRTKMQEQAARRAELLKAELKFPPERYKDVDAWVLADYSAIEEIRAWLN